QHVVVADRRYGQPAEAPDPEVAGAHAEHSESCVANRIELDGLRQDTAQLVERNPEIDGETLVGERVHADRLVVDTPHAPVQRPDVHGFSDWSDRGAHGVTLYRLTGMSDFGCRPGLTSRNPASGIPRRDSVR